MKLYKECEHIFAKGESEELKNRDVCQKCGRILVWRQEYLDLLRSKEPPRLMDEKEIIIKFCYQVESRARELKKNGVTKDYNFPRAMIELIDEKFAARIFQIRV